MGGHLSSVATRKRTRSPGDLPPAFLPGETQSHTASLVHGSNHTLTLIRGGCVSDRGKHKGSLDQYEINQRQHSQRVEKNRHFSRSKSKEKLILTGMKI